MRVSLFLPYMHCTVYYIFNATTSTGMEKEEGRKNKAFFDIPVCLCDEIKHY